MPIAKSIAFLAAASILLIGCDQGSDPGMKASEPPSASAEPTPESTAGSTTTAASGMFAIPLDDLDGNQTTLAAHAGKPMLIEVWATWCGPCRKVRSIIKENQDELESVATLVGVSVDQGGAAVVKNYLAKTPSPGMLEFMVTPEFRAAIAPLDTKNTVPKLIYVGPDGRIANLSYGVNSAPFMTGLLRNLGARNTG